MRRFTVNMKLARIFKRILETWNLAKTGKRSAKKRRAENMRTAVNHARISHGTVPGTYSAQIPVTLRYGATAGAAVKLREPRCSGHAPRKSEHSNSRPGCGQAPVARHDCGALLRLRAEDARDAGVPAAGLFLLRRCSRGLLVRLLGCGRPLRTCWRGLPRHG